MAVQICCMLDLLQVAYWNTRGLGAPVRMLCEYAGAPYEAVTYDLKCVGADGAEDPPRESKAGDGLFYDRSDWLDTKVKLKQKNAFINLPYVIDGDTIVSQSNSCLEYLGEKFGLMGCGDEGRRNAQQCLCQVFDLRNKAVGLFYGRFKLTADEYMKLPRLGITAQYGKLEAWLQTQDTDYLVCNTPTAPVHHIHVRKPQNLIYSHFSRV